MTLGEQLTNPAFWITTVFFGIIVGVMGNFLTSGIQAVWAKFSASQKAKLQAEDAAFQFLVQDLVDNPSKANDLKIDTIYSLLSSIAKLLFYLVLANLTVLLPLGAFGIIGSYIQIIVNAVISVLAVSNGLFVIKKDRSTRRLLREYEWRIEPKG